MSALEPVFGDRSLFGGLEPRIYLNHAAMSAPSAPVLSAVRAVVDSYARKGVAAFAQWIDNREVLRSRLGRIVGADGENIALLPNTTAGVVSVAQCLQWRAGERVVVFESEFPTNVTPWQQAAATFGLECVRLPLPVDSEGAPFLGRLQLELDRGVRLVAISAVQFQTGWRMPLEAIGAACRAAGALFFVDGIQAVGAVPLNCVELGIDFLACGGHKWLMGIEGAGFLYISPSALDELAPRLAGWMSHESAFDMLFAGPGHLKHDRPIRQRADFLEGGVYNSAGFAALEASTALLETLGYADVWRHISGWLDALDDGLAARSIQSCRRGFPGAKSAILSVPQSELTDRDSSCTVAHVAEVLGHLGVAVSTPDGHLRFAPHWPNDVAEVAPVLDALDEVLGLR